MNLTDREDQEHPVDQTDESCRVLEDCSVPDQGWCWLQEEDDSEEVTEDQMQMLLVRSLDRVCWEWTILWCISMPFQTSHLLSCFQSPAGQGSWLSFFQTCHCLMIEDSWSHWPARTEAGETVSTVPWQLINCGEFVDFYNSLMFTMVTSRRDTLSSETFFSWFTTAPSLLHLQVQILQISVSVWWCVMAGQVNCSWLDRTETVNIMRQFSVTTNHEKHEKHEK